MAFVVFLFLYFLPSLVALDKPQGRTTFLMNLLLGWTGFGWVAAMIIALGGGRRRYV